MRLNVIVSGAIVAIASTLPARAQVTIDASKITCDQYVHSKIAPTRVIGGWLSGFYNGRQDNRIFDLQKFEANLNRLEKFCYQEKNFNLPVMQAIEQVGGAK
jgi:acid stress chaperone HdeB